MRLHEQINTHLGLHLVGRGEHGVSCRHLMYRLLTYRLVTYRFPSICAVHRTAVPPEQKDVIAYAAAAVAAGAVVYGGVQVGAGNIFLYICIVYTFVHMCTAFI